MPSNNALRQDSEEYGVCVWGGGRYKEISRKGGRICELLKDGKKKRDWERRRKEEGERNRKEVYMYGADEKRNPE